MAAALRRVLGDERLRRASCAAAGLQRASLFTWSAAARDAVRLFEETVAVP